MNIDKISNISDEYLLALLESASRSALELTFKSFEYDIYMSGLSYGIWVSICDIESIALEEIADIMDDYIKSNLN
jgi:hypothetical protein